jgi:hypothetical protein
MVPLTEKPGDGGRSVVENSLELPAHDARVNKSVRIVVPSYSRPVRSQRTLKLMSDD